MPMATTLTLHSGYKPHRNNTYNHNTRKRQHGEREPRRRSNYSKSGGGWGSSEAARGYGSQDTGSHATAFSGYGGHLVQLFMRLGDRSPSSRDGGVEAAVAGGLGHVGGGGGIAGSDAAVLDFNG